jgi:hypothetical protein
MSGPWAQAVPPGGVSIVRLLVYGGVAIGAIVVLGAVLLLIRRRLHAPGLREAESGPAFTIEQLEAFRRMGTISEEEFSRLRRMALNLGSPAAEQKNTGSRPAEADDEE